MQNIGANILFSHAHSQLHSCVAMKRVNFAPTSLPDDIGTHKMHI